jgi:transposase
VGTQAEAKIVKPRKRWSIAEKRQFVEETQVVGVSVAAVARAHGVNANQLFAWRRLHEMGQLVERRSRALRPTTLLLPVTVREEAPVDAPVSSCAGPGAIHIQFPGAQLRVEGAVDAATLHLVLEYLRR